MLDPRMEMELSTSMPFRRRGERRRSRRAGGCTTGQREQRVAERREHEEIEWQIRSRGYAVVGVPASGPRVPARRAR